MVNDAYSHYCLGTDSLQRGNLEEALTHFQASLSLEPHFKSAERIAFVFEQMGKYNNASDMLQRAFQLNPNNNLVAVRYADWLFRNGDIEAARAIVEAILRRNSTYGPAKTLLARCDEQRAK